MPYCYLFQYPSYLSSPSRYPFRLVCMFSDMSPSFLSTSLLSGIMRYPTFICSFLSPWNKPLLQGALVPLNREKCLETKIWALRVLTALKRHCSQPPSAARSTYAFMSLFISVFIQIENHDFTWAPLISIQYKVCLTFLSSQWETPFLLSSVCIYMCVYIHTYITNTTNLKATGKMSELKCQTRVNNHCGEREGST